MKIFTLYLLLFLSVSFYSCGEKDADPGRTDSASNAPHLAGPQDYINHPAPGDTTCLQDIDQAKKDAAAGKIAFCKWRSMGGMEGERHTNELVALCKEHKLVFRESFSGCMITEGQTDYCYEAYMDNLIAQKFGSTFKKVLEDRADSLFLVRVINTNDTVEYWDCDSRPHLPGYPEQEECTMTVNLDTVLSKKISSHIPGAAPFFDISFYIDTTGRASGYYTRFIHDGDNPKIEKHQQEIFNSCIETLKYYQNWEPGRIRGRKVRTRNNVRVYFG